MASNVQKTPIVPTLNRFAEDKILTAIQQLGKNLPCQVVAVSNSIVTVKFLLNSVFTLPNVTIPEFGPEYIRYPTQVGDLGVTVSADVYLGGISALGGGIADLSIRANLSALLFLPVASKNWTPTDNPRKTLIYGPDGVIIRDVGKNSTFNVANNITSLNTPEFLVTATNSIELGAAGHSIVINSSGVIIDGRIFLDHMHDGVQTGGGDTGGVV